MKITEELISSVLCILMLAMTYMFSKVHIMNNLIMIEFMIITILMMMFTMTTMMKMENFLVLYFIVTAISESMIGLSLLIAVIRTHSNDFIKSINLMQF